MTNFNLPEQSMWMEKIKMTDEDCEMLSSLVTDYCGVKLGSFKKVMMQSRLDKRLTEINLSSYKEYINYLKNHKEEFEIAVNLLTTNKTEFWREKGHYDFLEEIAREISSSRRGHKPIYLWSAASSTGEEAYTMAMLLEEIKLAHGGPDYRILATDINTEVLQKAESGIYPGTDVSSFPPQYIHKYFRKGTGRNLDKYQVLPQIKNTIKFRHHNLIDGSLSFPIAFDVIFLRNVLIYFSKENIQIVIDKLVNHLNRGGYLIIGYSESLNGIKHNLKSLSGSIFQKM